MMTMMMRMVEEPSGRHHQSEPRHSDVSSLLDPWATFPTFLFFFSNPSQATSSARAFFGLIPHEQGVEGC